MKKRSPNTCEVCGNNWRKRPPSDSGCDTCKASRRAAAREESRLAAIWAKVQADESPCCAGARLTDTLHDGWFACAGCLLPVYKFAGMRGTLRAGNRQIGLTLHDRFAKAVRS
jgi:hypothetical protein